jgi:hypothetical protein
MNAFSASGLPLPAARISNAAIWQSLSRIGVAVLRIFQQRVMLLSA